jgi:hypothetical protein
LPGWWHKLSFASRLSFARLQFGKEFIMRILNGTFMLSAGLLAASAFLLRGATGDFPPLPPKAPGNTPTLPIFPAQDTSSVPVPNAPGTPAANGLGPKIQFAAPVYDFGRARSGDPVKFSYIFTNIGDAALELSNVQPQCGCTAAGEWTRKVEPGQTGTIPIQFNTASYSQAVLKTITVACNDKTQPVVVLQLKGTVWKPIELVPPYSVLNIMPDAAAATTVVRIINNMEEPLELSAPEASNPAFRAELKTNTPGKEFQLTISAVPPLNPGTLQGKVTIKTSATNSPTVEVPFWANVQAPVMVLPPQLMLPPAQQTNKALPSVTVQNNSTNALTVSDATINVPGAQVAIRELQPGRIFSLQLTLPEGFEIPQGQRTVVTFKTSHPQFQTVEVPVVQMPKPATPMAITPQGQPPLTKPFLKAPVPAQLTPPGPMVAVPTTNGIKLP